MNTELTTRALDPFGLEVTLPDGHRWEDIAPDTLHAWVMEHRVVVLRGLTPFAKEELPRAARRLGPLQSWMFGAVNELVPDDSAKNYLYTRRVVPLHWDGAFAKVPRYLFFQCVDAPDDDAGGETVFVDSTRVWKSADAETRDRWRALRFTYETEKVTHYGGSFTARAVSQHPYTHDTTLRFAEPVDDLNPVHVQAEGLSPLESAREITALRAALDDPSATLLHRWRAGDVVIADNHALLHGRRPFSRDSKRHLRRVNIHGPERDWRDALRDAVRIRRPEFMVAEVPILLIPALWVSGGFAGIDGWGFAELGLLFFLLFHFGDMVNCLADRDLDAVYKTWLSEAVHGLGVRNVAWQIALTTAASFALAGHLAWATGRWEIVGLVAAGLLMGHQYSYGPVRAKGAGLLQVLNLWAVIFVGPMLLVVTALGAEWTRELLALIVGYGAMQEGIILVNTAEDLPEDEAAGIRTTAVSLGLSRCLALATAMVAIGGGTVLAVVGRELVLSGRVVAGVPLVAAWAWVLAAVAKTWGAVQGLSRDEAVKAMRPRAKWVPAWITATAWATLVAAWAGRGV